VPRQGMLYDSEAALEMSRLQEEFCE